MLKIPKSKLQVLIKQFKLEYPEEFDLLKYIVDKWKDEVHFKAVQHGKSYVFSMVSPKREQKLIFWAVDPSGVIELGPGSQKTKEELVKLLDPNPVEDDFF